MNSHDGNSGKVALTAASSRCFISACSPPSRMMCLTSADALSRYAFNRPILGAFEITEKYLMVAAIFLGLSYGYRGGLFIRVTFLVDRLSGRRGSRPIISPSW